MVFAGSSPITTTSPSSKARQKSGPFPQPALPGFDGHTTPSDSRHGRRLSSSARASSDGGMTRPSALAVLRLMSSNWVGCSTGRSTGLTPVRTSLHIGCGVTAPMSLMGQKRRFDNPPVTSGLPSTPDILSARRHVSNVPPTEVTASFDHLVGAPEQRKRHGQSERLGALQIEKQLYFRG